MKTKIVVLTAVTSLCLAACRNTSKIKEETKSSVTATKNALKTSNIAFVVAKNYFVKNTVTRLDSPKIESADKFNSIFGMAAVMGKDGKPTEIDLSKQYVIAVVLPETDLATTIEPVSLQKAENGDVTFNYKVVVGEKQSFKIRPNLAIVVDKDNDGKVILKEVK